MTGTALGCAGSWREYLDLQEQAIPLAVAALGAGLAPTWPDVEPPAEPPTAEDRERATAIRTAAVSVEAAVRARHGELAVELAGLAHLRARPASADDPTLGASFDLSS